MYQQYFFSGKNIVGVGFCVTYTQSHVPMKHWIHILLFQEFNSAFDKNWIYLEQ